MFLLITSVKLVLGQISTPCTTSMISSFTPCANFITGSTNYNGLITPSSSCCDSLESMMSTSMDCACLLISANVPFQLLPINRVLSFFLPSACNLNGLPSQCKGTQLIIFPLITNYVIMQKKKKNWYIIYLAN
jgi:hypothetical protein